MKEFYEYDVYTHRHIDRFSYEHRMLLITYVPPSILPGFLHAATLSLWDYYLYIYNNLKVCVCWCYSQLLLYLMSVFIHWPLDVDHWCSLLLHILCLVFFVSLNIELMKRLYFIRVTPFLLMNCIMLISNELDDLLSHTWFI